MKKAKIDKEKIKDTLNTQNLKKIGKYILRERSQRFSLSILFIAFTVSVLFISLVLIVVSIWLLGYFGVIDSFGDNTSAIFTLIIVGQSSILISFGISFFFLRKSNTTSTVAEITRTAAFKVKRALQSEKCASPSAECFITPVENSVPGKVR